MRLFYWTKLFDIIDANISRDELDLNESHDIIVRKLYFITNRLFKIVNVLNIFECKYNYIFYSHQTIINYII